MTSFLDIALCSLVEADWRFRCAYCLCHQGDLKRRSSSTRLTTRRDIPEGCHLHTRRRENLKSHISRITIHEEREISVDNLTTDWSCNWIVTLSSRGRGKEKEKFVEILLPIFTLLKWKTVSYINFVPCYIKFLNSSSNNKVHETRLRIPPETFAP
jgi:hypothetical protein